MKFERVDSIVTSHHLQLLVLVPYIRFAFIQLGGQFGDALVLGQYGGV